MGSQPYLGSIHIFGLNFPPRGFAACNGQTLAISQNSALFSLLGTNYGGNGTSTYGLPDLRGRVPINMGQGPGLPIYDIGELAGTPSVTITTLQMPIHTHGFTGTGSGLNALTVKATTQTPAAGSMLGRSNDTSPAAAQPLIYVPAGTAGQTAALGGLTVAGTIAQTGGSQPLSIMQPYLALNFCIALTGIFPSRN
jgi:microcystin-dependent protein